ncbi:sulfotransferase [Pseudomonas sp. zbq_18]|uniref:sulfotransferase n=1 Tax=Pseudomonadota TaxID=1224 RepID=UPI00370C5A3B
MNTPMRDDQLIFMISLPRSGSTLLQKILGGHDDIHTRSEPWLMLHPLYALKHDGIQARYNARLAAQGVQDFIADLPGEGEEFYYARLRDCYLSLYAPYLQGSGKTRFLDKTPRYYEIFDELQKTFPRAKFIVLYRNPLAVLASILETWIKGNLARLREYRGDLCKGTEFLQRDFSAYDNTHIVRYEDLLRDPESATAALFAFLELPNQPECIDYGKQPAERWKYGDPSTVYAKSRPDAQHADAWQQQLNIAENRKLLADYLQMLGKAGFERMGYDYAQAELVINQSTPADSATAALPSLRQLLRSADEENKTLHDSLIKLSAEKDNLRAESMKLSAEKENLSQKTKSLLDELEKLKLSLQIKIEDSKSLERDLSNIIQSAKHLKEQRAFQQPFQKLKAYKALLSSIDESQHDHLRRSTSETE